MSTGFNSPGFLSIVSAAMNAATAAVATAEGERRLSSQSSDPPPVSSPPYINMSSKDDTSGLRSRRGNSVASATSETEGDGVEGGERPNPLEQSPSLATRSPDEAVRRTGSPKSEDSSISGGGGGSRFRCPEDVVVDVEVDGKLSLHQEKGGLVAEKTTGPQPRRPSGEKPSRTSEGRNSRPHKLTPGRESGSHIPPSTTPDNSGKTLDGKRSTTAGSIVVPAETPSPKAVADTSRDSVGQSYPRSGGDGADRSLDGVGLRGDDFGYCDDDRDKLSSLVGGGELRETTLDKEDFASDTFESLGEL